MQPPTQPDVKNAQFRILNGALCIILWWHVCWCNCCHVLFWSGVTNIDPRESPACSSASLLFRVDRFQDIEEHSIFRSAIWIRLCHSHATAFVAFIYVTLNLLAVISEMSILATLFLSPFAPLTSFSHSVGWFFCRWFGPILPDLRLSSLLSGRRSAGSGMASCLD
jgi:hypothetical protein